MHLTSLFSLAFVALSGLPYGTLAQENMAPREFTKTDGTLSTVHVNRDLEFVHTARASPSSQVSKRVTFKPGYDDYCSETNPTNTYGADAPLSADCTAIKQYMETITGYYTVSPNDFSQSTRWATVVSSGTCRFAIQFQIAADTKTVVIGTNDVHFYVQGVLPYAQNGKIKSTGAISCYNNGTMAILNWGMIHT